MRPLLAAFLLPLTAMGELAPGERFPDLNLPSIKTGETVAFSTLTGEKLMLHLFASW